MKYLLAIRVTNPETGEVDTDIFEFDNEFQREDTCWEIDQMKNPCIEYAITQDDWAVDGALNGTWLKEQICYVR